MWSEESRNHLFPKSIPRCHTCFAPCAVLPLWPQMWSLWSDLSSRFLFSVRQSLATLDRLNTKFQGFLKDVVWAKCGGPALAFTSSNADSENRKKFCLKMERDACQGMPWALKQAHNTWEIDVTREAFLSLEHMCTCFFFFFSFLLQTGWIKLE